MMGNKRARTGMPVRDNRIYGISIYRDGFPVTTLPFHYRRRMRSGEVYTGPANH